MASASGEIVAAPSKAGSPAGESVFQVSLVPIEDVRMPDAPSGRGPGEPDAASPEILHRRAAFDDLTMRLRQDADGGSPSKSKRPWSEELLVHSRSGEQPAQQHDPARVAATGAIQMANADSASTGALWGRISPCWDRLAHRGPHLIVVEVAFDQDGRLLRPPAILRPPGNISESLLRAEERALAALASCLPAIDPARAAKVFQVEFGPSSQAGS